MFIGGLRKSNMDLLDLSFRIAFWSLKLPFVANSKGKVGVTISDFDFFIVNLKLVI